MSNFPNFTVLTTDSDNNRYQKNSFYNVFLREKNDVYYYRDTITNSIAKYLSNQDTQFPLDCYPIDAENRHGLTIREIISGNFLTDLLTDSLYLNSKQNLTSILSKASHINLTKLPLFFSVELTHGYSYDYQDVITQSLNYNNSFAFNDSTDINPTSLRYFSSNGTIYVERPPFKAIVNYKPVRASGTTKHIESYEIWVPWTLTRISTSEYHHLSDRSFRIYFSSSPLTDTSDDQYVPCMFPNSYTDGTICFSNSLQEIPDFESQSIRYIYSMMINEYISGGWNLDLGLPVLQNSVLNPSDTYKEYCRPTYNSLLARFPDLTDSKIATLKSQSLSSSGSAHSKYFFKMMSSFNLEETLDFYSSFERMSFDKINSTNQSLSFSNDITGYIRSRNHHHEVLAGYTNVSELDKKIFITCFNHNNEDSVYKDTNKFIRSINKTKISSTWNDSVDYTDEFSSIFQEELSNMMNMEHSFIYLYYDKSSGDYEIHNSSNSSIETIVSMDIISDILIDQSLKEISI